MKTSSFTNDALPYNIGWCNPRHAMNGVTMLTKPVETGSCPDRWVQRIVGDRGEPVPCVR